METWRGIDATPEGRPASVVAIGVFDGVHRGHAALIRTAAKAAAERDARCVVVTFDPHPTAVVAPHAVPAQLTSVERRLELLEALGVDAVCVLPFTEELSKLSPDYFVRHVLVGGLHAKAVCVGENFRFGHKAAGDVAKLTELGEEFGFEVLPQTLTADDEAFSSTRVRRLVAEGDVSGAAEVLGRDFGLEGTVVHGAGRGGTALGFPTANLQVAPNTAIPADGVYAGWFYRDSHRHAAAISVGTNPTFDGAERTVEAYLLDFSGDLYGETVRLDFTARLRGQVAFEGVEPLIAQIETDVADTRRALELG
ncbi:bifunctional riboflavin kinase/FAD synthetase [Glycomyces harbinensis]|uniref:Riboflavin biosynthesis protein n=1 Tax=Glycomyces harbinensis TaxID=58114 RepID=A0A1G6T1T8_9ACTN|nr:bifunctional riboflavin kinase/FAD synthetase [Glycomyces harbinensis]SDD22989.1 riboflavin kinase / FMN adenylyltransferase [Glycomyces harbinensis]